MPPHFPEEMAAVFKKNKAKIEAYFAKQDLVAIIPELRLENLISNAEEREINSTESSKRAHTLTKILESKIVNNPDLFQNLKQILGSFEDFSESPLSETFTTIVTSSDGESGISHQTPIDLESPQTIIPGQTILITPVTVTQTWLSDVVKSSSSHPTSFPTTPITSYTTSHSKAGFYTTQPIEVQHCYSWQKKQQPGLVRGKASDQAPYRSTALSSTYTSVGYSSLHTVDTSQQRTTQPRTPVESTSEDDVYPIDTRRHRKKRSGTSSFGATEKYIPVSKTKSPVALIAPTSKTKKQPPQPYQPNCSEIFPGIDFSSYRSHATVGHKGSTIRGEGVELRIPPNAIKRGTSLDISLLGCISGPFSLPENTQLASPVFLLTCTPQYQFQREVTLTIHHFVLLQNRQQCKDMVLLTSPQMKVEDKDHIYWKFSFCDQQLQCFPHTSYGEVELTHFSFLCFGIRLSRGKSRL